MGHQATPAVDRQEAPQVHPQGSYAFSCSFAAGSRGCTRLKKPHRNLHVWGCAVVNLVVLQPTGAEAVHRREPGRPRALAATPLRWCSVLRITGITACCKEQVQSKKNCVRLRKRAHFCLDVLHQLSQTGPEGSSLKEKKSGSLHIERTAVAQGTERLPPECLTPTFAGVMHG